MFNILSLKIDPLLITAIVLCVSYSNNFRTYNTQLLYNVLYYFAIFYGYAKTSVYLEPFP